MYVDGLKKSNTISDDKIISYDEILDMTSSQWKVQSEASVLFTIDHLVNKYSVQSDLLLENHRLELLTICKPIISSSLASLRRKLNNKNISFNAFIIENALEALIPILMGRLSSISNRTIVLEMNVARLQGILNGSSPEERFLSYVELLKSPYYAEQLFQEYPLLAKQLVLCSKLWEEFCFEFLVRLEIDHSLLETTFTPYGALGQLTKILNEKGDAHNNGRCVLVAQFESGIKIVYKPRVIDLENKFQCFLSWFNQTSHEFDFKIIKVLARDDYGWVEHVKYQECRQPQEFESFYFRLGGLLAIIYTLQGNDFHHENIIACGDQPVAIDLETLFNPNLFSYRLDNQSYSVLDVGILPLREADPDKSDLSAVGANKNKKLMIKNWTNQRTDEICIGLVEHSIKQVNSSPSQNSNEALVVKYEKQLLEGFEQAYSNIFIHRTELSETDGPLSTFLNCQYRCVFRITEYYSKLLWRSYHPDNQRKFDDHRFFSNNLNNELAHRKFLANLVESESSALLQGDIPVFYALTNATSLSTQHIKSINNFFSTTPLISVKHRIGRYCKTHLDSQLWLIKHSISLLKPKTNHRIFRQAFGACSNIYSGQNLIKTVTDIGLFLNDIAIQNDTDATWLGYFNHGSSMGLNYLPGELYSGQLGIIWFLAYLGKTTNTKNHKRLAKKGLNYFIKYQLEPMFLQKSIGTFDGLCGVIYVFTHLQHLWPVQDLDHIIERVLVHLNEEFIKDRQLDIISGAAGNILVLLNYHHQSGNPLALQLAVSSGNLLLDLAIIEEHSLYWKSSHSRQKLTGFSHGIAGIAYALGELFKVTGDIKYIEAALRGIEFENQHYLTNLTNWQDLRADHQSDESPSALWSWCHGAPAILASRLKLSTHNDISTIQKKKILENCEEALAEFFNQANSSENNLCHGAFGNLDLLLSIALNNNDKKLADISKNYTQALLNKILTDTNPTNWLSNNKKVGIMLGVTGIGYALLRQMRPSQMPSLLLLENVKT